MSQYVERFTGRVEAYARYRTRYPRAVVEWLRTECGLAAEWAIADVGAGTGMLAELFLENGHAVTAVEPNAEMRAECERLGERFGRLRVVDGTAEQTGLDARSVEMVTAGRAFHWFEPVGAAVEFTRVMKPGGWMVIVESGRSRVETEQSKEFEALLMRYGTDFVHVRDRYRRVDRNAASLRLMGEEEPRHVEFAEELVMRWEAFAGWTQSMSVAPLPGTVGYAGMRAALEAFFARWSVDGELRVQMVCVVDAGRLPGTSIS